MCIRDRCIYICAVCSYLLYLKFEHCLFLECGKCQFWYSAVQQPAYVAETITSCQWIQLWIRSVWNMIIKIADHSATCLLYASAHPVCYSDYCMSLEVNSSALCSYTLLCGVIAKLCMVLTWTLIVVYVTCSLPRWVVQRAVQVTICKVLKITEGDQHCIPALWKSG